MPINSSLAKFRDCITKVNSYVDIAYEQKDDGQDKYSQDEKEFIVSSAFLKLFIGWEEFLESVFIKFLTGTPATTGSVILGYVSPIDEKHAQKIVIGNQKYVDWANHVIVMRLANLFFENGGPIASSIARIAQDMSDLRTIRNAVAHISTTTQRGIDAVASRKLERPISNIGVAEFITSISPEDPTKTILQTYQLVLDITAENIINNTT